MLFAVLAVLLVSYASSLRTWVDQRDHINDLEAQIATDSAAVDALTEEKQRWEDPAYVEAQARERFGWVLPGEIGYRVIDEDGKALGVTAELSEPDTQSTDESPAWWVTAWGSVEAAGKDPAEVRRDPPAEKIGPSGSKDVSGDR
ncbi:MAG: FtsB family cell division protein [Nocardioidaceae bacterium]